MRCQENIVFGKLIHRCRGICTGLSFSNSGCEQNVVLAGYTYFKNTWDRKKKRSQALQHFQSIPSEFLCPIPTVFSFKKSYMH